MKRILFILAMLLAGTALARAQAPPVKITDGVVPLQVLKILTMPGGTLTCPSDVGNCQFSVGSLGGGDVNGPGAATDNAIARWNGTAGEDIQNSVVTIADTTGDMAGVGTLNTHTIPGGTSTFTLRSDNLSVFSATTSAQLAGVISNETGTGVLVFNDTPTILTPTIASFTNATHNHSNAAGGGNLTTTAFGSGSKSGNTTVLATAGTPSSGKCLEWDADGNVVTAVSNAACGSGGSSSLVVGTTAVTSGTAGRVFYETAGNVLGEITGATSDGTNMTFGSGNARMTSPRVTTGILDANGNTSILVAATTSAVNGITVTNSATTDPVSIAAQGTATDLRLNLAPKGAGVLGVSAPIDMTGTATTTYTSPGGSSISTKIAIANIALPAFGQLIALGVPSTANADARVMTLLDQRTAGHQPTLTILSPDENQVAGLSWNGSNTIFTVSTPVSGGKILFDTEKAGLSGVGFSGLGSPANGTFTYCGDCTVTSAADNTCAGSGTGAFAFRLNSVWRCFNTQNAP